MTGRKTTLPDGACRCSELLEDRPGRCAPSPKPTCCHQSQDFRAWHASAHVPVELCAARLAGARCHVGAPQHLQARDGRGRGRPRRAFRYFPDFMERCALVHPPLVRLACSRSCDIHPFASAQMCRGDRAHDCRQRVSVAGVLRAGTMSNLSTVDVARRSVPQRPSPPALGLGEFQSLNKRPVPVSLLPLPPPLPLAEPSPLPRPFRRHHCSRRRRRPSPCRPAHHRPPPASRLPSRPRPPPPSLCPAGDDGDGVVGSGESPVVAAISSHSGSWQWQRPALSKVRRCVGDGGDQHMGSVNFNH